MPLVPGLGRSVRLLTTSGARWSGPSRWSRTGAEATFVYEVRRKAGLVLSFALVQTGPGALTRLSIEQPDGSVLPLGAAATDRAVMLGILLGTEMSGPLRIHVSSTADALLIEARVQRSGSAFADAAAAFLDRHGGQARWDLLGVPGFIATQTSRQLRDTVLDPNGTKAAVVHAANLGARCATQRGAQPHPEPLFSFVVPTCETPPRFLSDLLRSFRKQRPGSAELVLSDDGSTRAKTLAWLSEHQSAPGLTLVRREARGGIAAATNAGLSVARGTFVGLVDHDDALAPFATDVLADALQRRPETQYLFTDEVVTDRNLRPQGLMLKPAFDPVLLSGVNYLNHLSLYRRERLMALGGLREGYQGSQDYELVLRFTNGLGRDEITHVPFPAYHWRRHRKSFSAEAPGTATASARRALAHHFARQQPQVEAARTLDLHRVRFPARRRLVSVVIPTRDGFDMLGRLLTGLTQRTEAAELEIVIVDNGSTDPRMPGLYDALAREHPSSRVIHDHAPFNFSRLVNRGVAAARGECVLLLNNDIEITHPDWLSEMIECLEFPDVGIVGARLLYPKGHIQHAGVIVGLGRFAGHWHVGQPAETAGPMNRLHLRQSLSAVTGACMLVTRSCLEAVGPFDEERFAVAYNDVDFCLRAGRAGFRVVWTPNATLIHHESATRGSDEAPDKVARFNREKAALEARHATGAFQDPAFNPWYGTDRAVPVTVQPAILPAPR